MSSASDRVEVLMSKRAESKQPPQATTREPTSEEQLRAVTVGEVVRLDGKIVLADYDPEWPRRFAGEEAKIRVALGARALAVEHAGSTSVPGLPAKPILDIVLVVADAGDEASYVPNLEAVGFVLRIREPALDQHRMLAGTDPAINLHVFSEGCAEVTRMLGFRDWLRTHADDRDLYAHIKRQLAQRDWAYVQHYADAKTQVVEEILTRARRAGCAG
jgi:GrpB-like predicted nucleotidyltransferase (UPF0157 family)